MVPKVNVSEVDQGIIGVCAAITMALRQLGETVVVYFLDLVPERGEKLWDRFRDFQKTDGKDADFIQFIQKIITADPVKLFFPKECILNHEMTRQLLATGVQEAVSKNGAKSDTDILQIYFGEGKFYNIAREVSCKGCDMFNCRHNLKRKKR